MDTEKVVKKWVSATALLLRFVFPFPSRYEMAGGSDFLNVADS